MCILTSCGSDSLFQKQYDDVIDTISDAGISVDNQEKPGDGPSKSESATSENKDDEKNKEDTKPIKLRYAVVNDANEGRIFIDGADDIVIKDIVQGTLLQNGAILVYLGTNKELTTSNVDQSKTNVIAENVTWYMILDQNSLLYRDTANCYFKYRYKDGLLTEIGEIERYSISSSGNRLAYTQENALYILDSEASAPQKIADIKKILFIGYISADGSLICWADYDEKLKTLYSYYDGEVRVLATENDESGGVNCWFTYNEFSPLIRFYDHVIIMQNGLPVFDKLLSSDMRGKRFYTEQGLFESSAKDTQFSSIYSISSSNSSKREGKVFYYEQDGQDFSVLENIIDAVISNNKLYYADHDGNLMIADLDKGHMSNSRVVDEQVDCMITSLNGYTYYIKNSQTSNGDFAQDLYVYSDCDGLTQKIANNVYYVDYRDYPEFIFFSEDGKTCLFSVANYNEDSSLHNAELYDMCLYNYDSNEVEPFNELVYAGLVGLHDGFLDPDEIFYYKYNGTAPTDRELDLAYYYYDGSEHRELSQHRILSRGTYGQNQSY